MFYTAWRFIVGAIKGTLAAIALVVLGCIGLAWWHQWNTPEARKTEVQRVLKPSPALGASMTAVTLRVTNKGEIETPGAFITLLKGSAVYEDYLPKLKPGAFLDMPLIEFTTHQGERFNPLAFKPKQITISCDGYEPLYFRP